MIAPPSKPWTALESKSMRLASKCQLCGVERSVTQIARLHIGRDCLARVAAIAKDAGVDFYIFQPGTTAAKKDGA